jgi:hypothetical protein
MYNPSDSSPPSATDPASRNARYAYLVGRLRGRQITMEEATELFNLMQVSLARSESARLAAMAAVSSSSGAALTRIPPPPPPSGGATASGSDDFLLVGLLAMGVGAGLMAALTKRIQELTPPPANSGRTDSRAPSP